MVALACDGAVVSLVVNAFLRLRHTELDRILTIFLMDAIGPVVHGEPACLAPSEQFFDLWTNVGKPHRRPVYSPWNCLGGLQ
jgi:hypothetical protein